MTLYLGLGSNLGRRKQLISAALCELNQNGFSVCAVSPLVESPALLPAAFDHSWQRPYLNLVAAVVTEHSPEQILDVITHIEQKLGRKPAPRWAPRPIDIDVLHWDGCVVESPHLTIPHRKITERSFVLTPLLHLQPDLVIEQDGHRSKVIEWTQIVKPIPLFMAIVNLTPDSFANAGQRQIMDELEQKIKKLYEQGVHIIDFGAESTRPHATVVDPEIEWQRLQPALNVVNQVFQGSLLRPLISVDSRHPQTIERALDAGVDMINDVTGLKNPEIIALVKQAGCQVVAMHSLSVPVDPAEVLADQPSAVTQLNHVLDRQINTWLDLGLDLNRIIFDPGIGFGKTAAQSLNLLQNASLFRSSGLRVLVGHSRKSFMNIFSDKPFAKRDQETLGISMALCQQGVDIIRVHNAAWHLCAYRGWSHLQSDQGTGCEHK